MRNSLKVCACAALWIVATGISACDQPVAQTSVYYDLSHSVGTFHPLTDTPNTSDLDRPYENSRPGATSGGSQAVRIAKPNFPAKLGYFQWGMFLVDEHYSTHVDSQHHFIATDPDLQIENPDRRTVAGLTLDDLIGPIVFIDITDRVQGELDKNGGRPSADTAVTDFSDGGQATIRASDLEAVEPYLVDGAFIVLKLGWEQFFWGRWDGNGWMHPYNNGMNHPGMTREAVEWLLAFENRTGIRINGFVADNVAVESGESILGEGGSVSGAMPVLNGLYLHAAGLQHGWKIVENAANLGVLADHPQGSCKLIIGAPKVAGASGTPARLIAECRDPAG